MSQIQSMKCIFQDRPNEWIGLDEIFRKCFELGLTNITGRISDLRLKEGMDIINRREKQPNGVLYSEYKYTPQESQQEMFA